MTTQSILVTGGAGFIGSHVVNRLHSNGYHAVVFDNLCTGNKKAITCESFVEGDLKDLNKLRSVFKNFNICAVMHFAAFIDVRESVEDPAKYYLNNVSNTLNLLEVMREFKVDKFIFSSTAAIFGLPEHTPIRIDHPCHPINPYGETKLMVENMLHAYSKAYRLNYCTFRYFNASGGDPLGRLKNNKIKETNLIPLVLKSIQQNTAFTIYGTNYPTKDGTCVRDYVHVDDLATAHQLGLKQLFMQKGCFCYNLGNGTGYSVLDVIAMAEKVTGQKLTLIYGPKRAGDPPILIADSQQARLALNWEPKYPGLHSMVEHAWNALIFN